MRKIFAAGEVEISFAGYEKRKENKRGRGYAHSYNVVHVEGLAKILFGHKSDSALMPCWHTINAVYNEKGEKV